MSNLIAQNKFAELCGVSAPAISKAIKQQRLKKVGTKIDLDCDLSKGYLKNQQESTPAPAEKTGKKKTGKKKPEQETPPPSTDDGTPLHLSLDLTDRQLLLFQKVEIEKLYKIEQAKEKKLKREIELGKYVEQDIAKKVFSKIYTIDAEQLRTLEFSLISKICGIFEVSEDSEEATEVKKNINIETSKILKSTQRVIDDFLNGLEVRNTKH